MDDNIERAFLNTVDDWCEESNLPSKIYIELMAVAHALYKMRMTNWELVRNGKGLAALNAQLLRKNGDLLRQVMMLEDEKRIIVESLPLTLRSGKELPPICDLPSKRD